MKNNKLIPAVIIGGILILVALIYTLNAVKNYTPQSRLSPTPVPVVTVTRNSYKQIEAMPTLEPLRGAGIDLESTGVKESKMEIQKLSVNLPFSREIRISESETISLQIPELQYQTNSWILTVYVYGIEYNVPRNTPEYTENKKLFLRASGELFGWMSSKNIDPKKIIIQWDDKAYIQNRAEEWLR